MLIQRLALPMIWRGEDERSCVGLLSGRARVPAICGLRVSPEIAFTIFGSLGREVLGDDFEGLIVGCDLIAVGPIGSEDHAIRAEQVPEGIQFLAVVALVENEGAILNDGDLRELDVDMRAAREHSEIVMICGERVCVGGELQVWQVVDDDAKFRNVLDDPQQGGDEAGVGVGAFEHKARIGKSTKAIEKVRLADVGEQITVPEIAVADSEKERVFVEPVEVGAVGGIGGIEVPDDSEDEWMRRGKVEKPVVVR